MKNSNDNESRLWKLLGTEGLADLSQFHRPRFYDEVPLFSRESDIAFLMEDSRAAASGILVTFGLKLLKSIISYEEHRTPYLATITIWNDSGVDLLVPNLFIWCGPIRPLEKKWLLHEPTTSFGRHVERMVKKLRFPDQLEVLEETSTIREWSRVFIGWAVPPYRSFVTLDRFRKTRIKSVPSRDGGRRRAGDDLRHLLGAMIRDYDSFISSAHPMGTGSESSRCQSPFGERR